MGVRVKHLNKIKGRSIFFLEGRISFPPESVEICTYGRFFSRRAYFISSRKCRNLHIQYARTDLYKSQLRIYGPKLWNEIDQNIIGTSPHLHSFKGKFEKYLHIILWMLVLQLFYVVYAARCSSIFCSENNLLKGSPLDKHRLFRFAPFFLIAMIIFSYLLDCYFLLKIAFFVFPLCYFQWREIQNFDWYFM